MIISYPSGRERFSPGTNADAFEDGTVRPSPRVGCTRAGGTIAAPPSHTKPVLSNLGIAHQSQDGRGAEVVFRRGVGQEHTTTRRRAGAARYWAPLFRARHSN